MLKDLAISATFLRCQTQAFYNKELENVGVKRPIINTLICVAQCILFHIIKSLYFNAHCNFKNVESAINSGEDTQA